MEPFLVSGALLFVGAQRLMRRVCKECAVSYEPSAKLLEEVGLVEKVEKGTVFYKGKGCTICNKTGYRGRMAVMEALEVDDDMRDLILRKAPDVEIRKVAISNGMIPLKENALKKVIRGDSTLEELARVAGTF